MDQLNLEILTEYAALKEQEAQIAAKLDELKPQVIAEIEKQGKDANNYQGAFGTYTVKERKSWQYSELYELKKKDSDKALKKLRDAEQESGDAKCEIEKSLSFLPAKEN